MGNFIHARYNPFHSTIRIRFYCEIVKLTPVDNPNHSTIHFTTHSTNYLLDLDVIHNLEIFFSTICAIANFVIQQSQGKQSSDDCRSIYCSALNSTLQSRERKNFFQRFCLSPGIIATAAATMMLARRSWMALVGTPTSTGKLWRGLIPSDYHLKMRSSLTSNPFAGKYDALAAVFLVSACAGSEARLPAKSEKRAAVINLIRQ